MKQDARLALVVGFAVLLGWAWLHFVHDPAVRRTAELARRDAVVDSMVRIWKDSTDAWMARDQARADSTRVLTVTIDSLRRRQPGVRRVTDTLIAAIPDTAMRRALNETLARERAVADSIHRADSVRAILLNAAIGDRDTRLEQAARTIDSLVVMRDAWKRAAGKRVGWACVAGPVVSTAGAAPIGVSCGLSLKIL